MKPINHPKGATLLEWLKMLGIASLSLIILALYTDVQAGQQSPLQGFVPMLQRLSGNAQAGQKQSPLQPKRFASMAQLKRILSTKTLPDYYFYPKISTLADNDAFSATGAGLTAGIIEHSETNVQVQGVDEGDTVKTDGQHIYSIQNGLVQIIRAFPANELATAATLQFEAEFNPRELYVQGDQLVVIGSGWYEEKNGAAGANPALSKMALWTPSGESRTMARIYNIADRSQPVMQREITFSGDYLSSRKIGESVYLIGRTYPRYYYFTGAISAATPLEKSTIPQDTLLPRISDSAVAKGKQRSLPLTDLYYFPNFVEPNYVVVAGFNLNALNKQADIKAYLGSGNIAYASADNLYLSAADYNSNTAADPSVSAPVTHLYKFALTKGTLNFKKAGEVPGVALNSFSMDEHKGYFRIATTVDQWTATSQQTWNNLYTLDSNMNVAGRLEHLAEGERIYSARFMGDRSYLVTFRQTDPLFVIDLSAPAQPKVLGELKIPGFSNYLHPYDENHILGFGQDTEVSSTGDVVTKGMKLALFDVTDVAHPTQLHSLAIGDQGTYSPLQYDHKALLFDKKRNLLGFPITVTRENKQQNCGVTWTWPSTVFQGAQVYSISLAGGFQKQADISHHDNGNYYDWYRTIDRLLTIGDQLYTLSATRVQANDLAQFKLTGGLDFPAPEGEGSAYYPTDVTECNPFLISPAIDDLITPDSGTEEPGVKAIPI